MPTVAALADAYLWLKAVHIVAVVAWMAGLLYLPRLFVYHAGIDPTSEASALFKVMERRLLRAIMNPAMIATWLLGCLMVLAEPGWLRDGWFHAKLAMVIAMTGMHMGMARWRRDFERNANARSGRFYRIANEVPTVLLIGVVILVVLKPF